MNSIFDSCPRCGGLVIEEKVGHPVCTQCGPLQNRNTSWLQELTPLTLDEIQGPDMTTDSQD